MRELRFPEISGLIASSFIWTGTAVAAHPPLPTPCPVSSACGAALQPFVQFGAATLTPNGNSLNVNQTSSKAILNWADFNIASGFTVNFIQPSSTSAVLNNIWSADPSVIAGRLNANGQVYLYNQNGIIFDKGAQIDVGSLTASTLGFAPVANSQDPDALFENGILSGSGSVPLKPVFVGPANATPGAITVNNGASLTATDGGRILLLGSAVTNNGSISTPDGQTILGAASKAVYLVASSSPDMRGLLIQVDGGGTTGTVINGGQISAPRGNITLAGLIVNQEGVLSATTSVSANGSIYLVAGDTSGNGNFNNPSPTDANGKATAFGGLLPNNGGALLLAPGSVTEVLPDSTDTATLTASQQAGFVPSQVDLAGKVVQLQGNASIHAPGGTVNAYASANPYQLHTNPGQPLADGGSLYLDSGSSIDVSGLQAVAVPVTQNLVQVTLETNDLQNDPLLRNGFLHGATVTVDITRPPSLFDVTPYAQNIGINIDQILTAAGAINLQSTGTLITRAGSSLNVSGGSTAFQGGFGPSTTNLLAADGQVFNISSAPSTIEYVGIANGYSYTDPTWGVTNKVNGQSYYAGYTQGANAGSISVQAPQVYLRGSLSAATVDGLRQRTLASLAEGGTFALGCAGCGVVGAPDFGVNGGVTFSDGLTDNLIGNVVLNGNVISSVSIPAVTELSPTQLTQSGFSNIQVASNGRVTLPAGVTLNIAANGSFSAKSITGIDIAGNIREPGGSVNLQTVAASSRDLTSHDITFEQGAIIDVSGGWTNDSPTVTPQPGTAPVIINGGSVSASAAGSVFLGAASLINVSGGAWINQSNALTEGTAGRISLAANFSLDPAQPTTNPFTGLVDFGAGATLLGASLKPGGGGTLAIQSGSLTLANASAGTPGELLLTPGFLTQGGFAQYNLTGQNDVIVGNPKDVADGAPVIIAPLQQTLVFTHNAFLQPTGSSLAGFTRLETLPLALRAPASVSFTATASDSGFHADIGDVTLARDASIVTDPGASVALAANGFNGNVRVFGSITAPGGAITLQLENPQTPLQGGGDPGFLANQVIELGPDATLSAPGYAKIDTLDPHGYREGSILAGGTISLLANKGFVKTDPGSLINVSGASGTLDLVGVNGVVTTLAASNAGTIDIGAREGIVLQGELLAQAASLNGAPIGGAGGGTLNLTLGLNYTNAGPNATAALNALGAPKYPTALRTLTLSGLGPAGSPAVAPSNQLLSGTAIIDVSTIQSGGFANVAITSADAIAFSGAVTLGAAARLTLDAPSFLGNPLAQVNLSAPYIAVGNYLNNSDYFDTTGASPNAAAVLNPVAGSATVSLNAQLIDVRGISGWSGFSQEDFVSSGDIRFVASANSIGAPPSVNVPGNLSFEGALNTAANLTLQGAQLYPTTATGFAINDLPSPGSLLAAASPTSVTISASASTGTPSTPLSAGGSITINATDITQGGVLRAPQGQIALNGVSILDAQGAIVTPGSVILADGSLTSVSADGLLIPFGSTANGIQWTYSPAAGLTNILTQPPAKQVSLNGSSVSVSSGAKVDLSGGGDLYAYEFVAGQGGSVDVLDPANLSAANHPAGTTVFTYAILPSLGSIFAPIDAQYGQGFTGTNQTITVSGVPGLAAGTYALLPARYALLPGAFAVQVVQQNSGIVAGSSVAQPSGAYQVAARFGVAGTGIQSSLTSTVLVASDASVRTESQYTDSFANAFFNSAAQSSATAAPRLPADAGQLLLSATNNLVLNGSITFGRGSFVSGTTSSGAPITTQGQGGDVAITAQNIVVVDASAAAASAAPGTLQLNVQQLDNLDAQTLILGASSSNTTAGELLNVGATQTVELKNTTALSAPEIILAARDSVTVDSNAQINTGAASGAAGQAPVALVLAGGGALLRVSNGAAATVDVDPASLPQNPTGIVNIGSAATVSASGSLLLYGTNNTTLAPDALITAPAVSLFSSVVSLGDVPAGTPGLTLTAQLLGGLKGLTDLTIGSSSTIDFFGAVQLGTPGSATAGLNSISLDAAGIGGYGAGDKVLQAGNIRLVNSSGATANFAAAPEGNGALQLIAGATTSTSGQLTLGPGAKTIAGFSSIDLQAAGDLLGQGNGSLTVLSQAPVPINATSLAIVGSAGSNQTLTATGVVTLNAAAANSKLLSPAPGVGAALTIQGSAIAQNGVINLPAGILSLTASNGDVTLGNGSVTSAAGAVQNYTVTSAVAAGGSIDLLSQTGNVAIGSGATLDVSGASYGAGAVNGDAGSLSISAAHGTFAFAGSTLKGGAVSGQSQGSFSLDENSGLAGSGLGALVSALSAGGFNGAVDLRTRGDTAVTIASTVQAASFQLAVDQGTIDVAGTGVINTSGSLGLNSNGGSISLWAGNGLTLEGGAQLLANAGANGPLGANGSRLIARGGDITLDTTSGNLAIDGGTMQQPTVLSLQGGAGGGADSDGTLTLRAPRTASDTGVQIQIQNSSSLSLLTRKPVIVEGFKTYSASSLGDADAHCGGGGTCDVNDLNGLLFTDAQTFAANSSLIASGLAIGNVEVRPGIEIDSSGDLVLKDSTGVWNLAAWNAALGSPTNVTLRATGNLVLSSSLSDGFSSNGRAVNTWAFGEPAGASSDSASYTLTAGADLAAANPLAFTPQPTSASSLDAPPNTGNVILSAGNLIRTGTGNIAVAAGADLLLGYSVGDTFGNLYNNGTLQVAELDPLSSVIYTAGVPSVLTAQQSAQFVPTTLSFRLTRTGNAVSYPTGGGDISIAAADDVRSSTSAQLVSDWLWRRGQSDTVLSPTSGTSWWLNFSQFEQGIGVLGGGNLSLSAGRDIVNTDTIISTTGRLLATGAPATAADLVLTGGGNLSVRAGGNIISGIFGDDWGNASLVSGGALTSSSNSTFGQQIAGIDTSSVSGLPAPSTEIYPVLVVGNGVFGVSARTGIALDGVANSTTLPLIAANAALVSATGEDASFYPYAPSANPSTLNLLTSAGNVVLNNDPLSNVPIAALSAVNLVYEHSPDPTNYLAVYPSTLNVVSLSGDIDLGAPPTPQSAPNGVNVILFPAAMGNLNLLAAGSIKNDGPIYHLTLSEADPTQVPNILAPQDGLNFPGLNGAPLPQVPLHQNDPQPISLVANSGDIDSGQIIFPKSANLIAGGNIVDLLYNGKNLNPSDVTLIAAGGDISYSTPTQPVTNALLSNLNGISLAGPGFLEVLAGGSINLGDANGIVTTGSLSDLRLPTAGATAIVGAGFGTNSDGSLRQPAYQAFTNAYLAPNASTGAPSSYAQTLIGYLQQLNPNAPAVSYAAALTSFEALTPAQQLPLLAQVLSDELSATGLAHTLQGTNYDRGYTAINTLFPAMAANGDTLSYNGNLDMFFSQVKTEQGGDINLLVPGGSVIVGLANPPASLNTVKQVNLESGLVTPAAVSLGTLVLGEGAIQGFAAQDFLVNQSRILTLEGGNIILWASNGNIDAGKGAKSASGAPPPVIQTDSNGNLFVDPSNSVSGSGIGQLLTTPGVKAGLVNLIAPKGAVNAGDAGIRVAGNLNIAAVQVIGAGNITVVGTSTGVPVSDAGALAGALSGANSLGDAGKNAAAQLSQDLGAASNYQQLTDSLVPNFIVVKLFCLGVDCETK